MVPVLTYQDIVDHILPIEWIDDTKNKINKYKVYHNVIKFYIDTPRSKKTKKKKK